MDLVSGIQHIENRLGGQKSSQGKGRSAQKNTRAITQKEPGLHADEGHVVPEYDVHIGRIVDTTA